MRKPAEWKKWGVLLSAAPAGGGPAAWTRSRLVITRLRCLQVEVIPAQLQLQVVVFGALQSLHWGPISQPILKRSLILFAGNIVSVG